MPDSHSDRDHAEFSPSSLKYVAGCPGYEGRSGTSAAAEKGTRIHEALEIEDPSNLESEEEVDIYNQIMVQESGFLKEFTDQGVTILEDLKEIQLNVELTGTETWGTCDRLSIFDNQTAVLGDYKTGISVIDSPEINRQAQAYTVGAFQKYPDITEITFVFYVPVRNEVLSHKFHRDDLPGLVAQLSKIIKDGERIRPRWKLGEQDLSDLSPTVNCRFCKHEETCPALGYLVISVAKKINPDLPEVDFDSTDNPEIVEQLWVIAKIVSNWSQRLKKRAIEMAQEGVEFPTLKLKSMGSPRKISDNEAMLKVAEGYGMTLETILGLASIPLGKLSKEAAANAEKGNKKKISDEFLDDLESQGIIETSNPRFTLG